MRILHGIANLDITTGGPPRSCLGMAGAVAKLGHDVTIVTTDRNFQSSFLGRANGWNPLHSSTPWDTSLHVYQHHRIPKYVMEILFQKVVNARCRESNFRGYHLPTS